MLKRSVMTLCILWIVSVTGIVSAAGKTVFTDIPTNNELGHAVEQLVEQNIISGYPDNTYRPSQQVTRGQVASLIDRALELELKHEKKTFKDVNVNSSHAKSISRVQQAGIMDGYADGTFKPNDALTRAQMAKVLAIAFDLPKAKTYGFKDVSKDHWAAPHIDSMASVKITLGSNGNYMPNQAVTRGHYAQFMYRAILWNQDEENSIVKDGVVVQPKPDFEPQKPQPQPKPEAKPQPEPQKGSVSQVKTSLIPWASLKENTGYQLAYSSNKSLFKNVKAQEIIVSPGMNTVTVILSYDGETAMYGLNGNDELYVNLVDPNFSNDENLEIYYLLMEVKEYHKHLY